MARELTASELALLKAELIDDPEAIGYTDGTSDQVSDLVDEDKLNSEETGRTKDREFVQGYDLLAAADVGELKALSAIDRERFTMLLVAAPIPINNANVRNLVLDLFAAGTTTRANLAALQVEPTSRAEELFGVPVHYYHIRRARDL